MGTSLNTKILDAMGTHFALVERRRTLSREIRRSRAGIRALLALREERAKKGRAAGGPGGGVDWESTAATLPGIGAEDKANV